MAGCLRVACVLLGPAHWAAADPDVEGTFQFQGQGTSCIVVVNIYFPDNPETYVPRRYTYVYQLICLPLNNFVFSFKLLDLSPSSIDGTASLHNEPGVTGTVNGVGHWSFNPFRGDSTQPLYLIATAGPVSGRGVLSSIGGSEVTAPVLVPGKATRGAQSQGSP